jgi:UDP-3-O-[3-hydroxymyristoyl] N-acetylglucosamine deacetylase / 3-hydroxyacyl-[acyl-carrier-protein] dehydratase
MNKITLKDVVTLKGIGLHTGKEIVVKIIPNEIDGGIKFKRVDLEPPIIINADAIHVSNTQRSTTITSGEASVSTIEHILSALSGLNIDAALIEVDGPEIPILDGSSKPFVEAIKSIGLKETEDQREYIVIEETISLSDPNTGSQIVAIPSDKFELNVIIDFNNSRINHQTAIFNEDIDYDTAIAPCRTFVFTNELIALADSGLIKGGNINNAVILAEQNLTQEGLDALTTKFGLQARSLPKNGIINDEELHFDNEMARHKLLDLMGDLVLAGKPIKGKIIAIKPGHKINTDFAELVRQKGLEQRKLKGKPLYDPSKEPILDTEAIKKLLPHRYPFLLVDRIIEISPKQVVGIKNVTFNEGLFQGHFPGNPIFPGVLQMEALAQTGGILALSAVEDATQWDTYFLKMDNVKFKAKVVPGDTMILKMELLSPIRRGIVHMQGTVYVANKIVSEGELTAQIVKKSN